MSSFIFGSEKVHLTYKTHLDVDKVRAHMAALGDIRMFSHAQEDGDVDESNPTPYAHTHVFVWWKKRVKSTRVKVFDIDEIHPNVQTRRAMDWAKLIVLKYHLGHKTKKDGKKYFIEPVALVQEGVEEWKWAEEAWDRIRDAPSLRDACLDAGIEPKSIGDAKAVRAQGVKRGFAELQDDCDKEWIPIKKTATWEWNPKKESLIVFGHSHTGKTNWAIAQFEKAFVIEDVDDLKNIPEGTTGLVFDDCEFAKLKLQAQKALSDVRVGKTVRARHVNAFKPRLPAIFTTNSLESLFDFDGDTRAVGNRCRIWETGMQNMYSN